MARKLRVEYPGATEVCKQTDWQRVRQETTMTLTWIAKRLNMGTAGSLANLPRTVEKNENIRLCGTDPFMNILVKILISLFASVFLTGCCSVSPNKAVAEFQRKSPKEFHQYLYLNPVSLGTYRAVSGIFVGHLSYVINETGRRFGDAPGIKEFTSKMAEQEVSERKKLNDCFRNLEEMSAGGGAICQYEWRDGKTREIGLLALKSGVVVKREPLHTDFLSESP